MNSMPRENAVYIRRISRQEKQVMILHYDAEARGLRPWHWLVDVYSIPPIHD
jgi:hypothetical protein